MRTIIRNNYDPQLGAYHEKLIIDEARHKKWLFDCDGVFTDITNPLVVSERGDSEDFAASQKWVTDIDDRVDGLAEDLGDEIQARTDADNAIWEEIEEIEMSSDVVDIVGTYAELQQYDTSHLSNNDIIKVLQDETHQNETSYYRWNASTDVFSYVGSEGPYYTESEIDTMMSDKQDTLIAGANINIVNNVISADVPSVVQTLGASTTDVMSQNAVTGMIYHDPSSISQGTSIAIGRNITVDEHDNGIAIGDGSKSFNLGINVGSLSLTQGAQAPEGGVFIGHVTLAGTSSNDGVVAIGGGVTTAGDVPVAIGESAYAGPESVAVGSAATSGRGGVAIGYSADASDDGVAIGAGAEVHSTANYSVALGLGAIASRAYSVSVGGNNSTRVITNVTDPTQAQDAATKHYVDNLVSDFTAALILYTDYNFYALPTTNASLTNPVTFYRDKNMTTVIAPSEIFQEAQIDDDIPVIIRNIYGDFNYTFTPALEFDDNYGVYRLAILDPITKAVFNLSVYSDIPSTSFTDGNRVNLQPLLTAGNNIQILDNTISVTGMPKLYTVMGQNTDGAVTQKLFTDAVGDIETALQILNSGAGVP